MKDFFISYTNADKAWAEWIAWQLETEDYTTVIKAWDFPPGANFVLEMQTASSKANQTIAVLSSDYLNATFTHPEWASAFAQDPTGVKRKLIPVRIKQIDPEGILSPIVFIDLVGLSEQDAKKALINGIQKGRAKPEHKPGFPGKENDHTSKQPPFPGLHQKETQVFHTNNETKSKATIYSIEKTTTIPSHRLVVDNLTESLGIAQNLKTLFRSYSKYSPARVTIDKALNYIETIEELIISIRHIFFEDLLFDEFLDDYDNINIAIDLLTESLNKNKRENEIFLSSSELEKQIELLLRKIERIVAHGTDRDSNHQSTKAKIFDLKPNK